MFASFPADAFGDPFRIEDLPLPRPAVGYGVQWLGTDTLLDRTQQCFLPIRTPQLSPVFADFAQAHAAASRWLESRPETSALPPLSIVPLAFDALLERHVLVYGVLCDKP